MTGKKMLLLMAFAMVAALLAGCSGSNPKASEQLSTDRPAKEAEKGVKEIFPLTGTTGATTIDKRPFAVVINNDVKARPQSGLHKADIVYEVLAEGDITRFLAIYQSEIPPGSIGPVRSARSYFVDLAKGYNPIFVFHGWSPEAKDKIQAKEVDGLNGLTFDGTLFKRASFRVAPHNSYITYDNIEKGASQLEYPLEDVVPALSFQPDGEGLAGDETGYVKITYSSREATQVEYKFEETANHYVRYSGGEKSVDLDTSEEIIAHNILIMEADHTIVDEAGRREIDITSGGRAILIQNGARQELEWKVENGRILPYRNGNPAPLAPGKTWIQIIPDLSNVTY